MRALIPALLLVSTPAFAADELSVSATLSDAAVPLGDIVTLEVRAIARVDGEIQLSIPSVKGLSELSRSQSQGTSISWNGARQSITREQTVTVELQTEKAGAIAIPPIVARLGRHSAKSTALSLVVGAIDLPENIENVEAGKVAPPGPGEGDIFVRFRVDKNEVFLGEQVLLDCDVFAAPGQSLNVESRDPPPALDGFWQEVVDMPQRLTRRVETIQGRSYHVYRLWRIALFPLEAGERTIAPTSVSLAKGRTIFGSGRRMRRRTLPIAIDVKPLPTAGRPADFSNNNVGQYLLSASLDHDRVPAGKAVLLRLSLSGVGNIKSARLPEVKAIDGFRVFPPTIRDNTQVTPNGLRGTKTAEILLMPQRGGRLEVPSFALTVFDPSTGAYERRTTNTMRVVVDGEPSKTDAPPVPTETAEKKALDLRPIRFRSSLAKHDPTPWRQPWFAAAAGAPWLLFVLFMALKRIRSRASQETEASKKRAAQQAAKSQLAAAKEALDAGDVASAYAKFAEALIAYGTNKCGIALRGQTADGVRNALLERGATKELAAAVAEELEAADYARFAPGTLSGSGGGAYERWSSIFEQLEAFETEGES